MHCPRNGDRFPLRKNDEIFFCILIGRFIEAIIQIFRKNRLGILEGGNHMGVCPEQFSRTALLLGEEAVQKLQHATVAVFGLGGVGSHAAEALARTGVGKLVLIDHDTVAESNINRQVPALFSAIGRKKVDVMRERLLDIAPNLKIDTHDCFYLPGNSDHLLENCDYVIDAIDTVSGKLALVEEARETGVPMISCMGIGNKRDPSRIEISDLSKTSVCPLCRVMRRELKKRGIFHLKVVYSKEEPVRPSGLPLPGEKPVPGSLVYVTATAGLLLAAAVVQDLIKNP